MTDREKFNLHLGDALHNLERALSANQGERETLIIEAEDILDYVLRGERNSEY